MAKDDRETMDDALIQCLLAWFQVAVSQPPFFDGMVWRTKICLGLAMPLLAQNSDRCARNGLRIHRVLAHSKCVQGVGEEMVEGRKPTSG